MESGSGRLVADSEAFGLLTQPEETGAASLATRPNTRDWCPATFACSYAGPPVDS